MDKTKTNCVCCRQAFIRHRNPNQRYCSQPVCQRARKRMWQKQKYASDPDYRDNQRAAEENWRLRHPDYWRDYRKTHEDYTQRNRERQVIRDRRRSQKVCQDDAQPDAPLAKSDALEGTKTPSGLVKSGFYRLIPVGYPDLAKSDAFMVEISVVARV